MKKNEKTCFFLCFSCVVNSNLKHAFKKTCFTESVLQFKFEIKTQIKKTCFVENAFSVFLIRIKTIFDSS